MFDRKHGSIIQHRPPHTHLSGNEEPLSPYTPAHGSLLPPLHVEQHAPVLSPLSTFLPLHGLNPDPLMPMSASETITIRDACRSNKPSNEPTQSMSSICSLIPIESLTLEDPLPSSQDTSDAPIFTTIPTAAIFGKLEMHHATGFWIFQPLLSQDIEPSGPPPLWPILDNASVVHDLGLTSGFTSIPYPLEI